MNPISIIQVNAVVAEAYGGPSIGSVALNAELRQQGANATLYSTGLGGRSGLVISEAELERHRATGARLEMHEPAWPSQMQNGKGILRSIFRAARSSDLIHIHGQYQLPHIYAYLAARWFRIPYGVQVHGGLEPYQRAKSKIKKRLFNLIIGKQILDHATYVHFASASEAEGAADVVRPDQRVVVPLGASLPVERPVRSLRAALESRPESEVVLFLGRLTHKKRPDLLLEAWAQAVRPSQAILIIAGPDADVTSHALRLRAADLGILDSVHFPGQVTGPEKSWLYKRCGTFVLPSENENFGLTVGEAMLGGCHVIVSSEVAASGFLTDSKSGTVLADMTTESLSSALSTALASDEFVSASGQAALAYAAERLSWKPLASALIAQASRAT